MSQVSIGARLNRLPITRTHKFLIAATGLGTFFEMYDILLAATLAMVLTQKFHLSAVTLPLVMGSGFLGMFIGCLVLGSLGDRRGRRSLFMISLAVYSVFTLIGAFSVNASMLIITRFIAGIGLGVEFPVVDTYLGDMLPARYRGVGTAVALAIGTCGYSTVGFLSRVLVPAHPLGWDGWRWLFVIGSLGAVIVWTIRRQLPESSRWLESVGRVDEAEAITRKMEEEALATLGGRPLPTPSSEEVVIPKKLPWTYMFHRTYRGRVAVLWILEIFQTAGFYGFATMVPMVLVAKGFSIVNSLLYTGLSFLGYPIGGIIATALAERIQRKWLIVGSTFIIGLFGMLLAFATSAVPIVIYAFIVVVAGSGLGTGLHIFQAEIFPTAIRSTATSISYGLSRLAGGALPFVLVPLLKSRGPIAMLTAITISMLIVMLDVGIFAPRTTGRALESLNVVE